VLRFNETAYRMLQMIRDCPIRQHVTASTEIEILFSASPFNFIFTNFLALIYHYLIDSHYGPISFAFSSAVVNESGLRLLPMHAFTRQDTFEASLAGGSSAHDWLESNMCREKSCVTG